jgi:hypothetical protein
MQRHDRGQAFRRRRLNMASGSSLLGLSEVKIGSSAIRTAISAIFGRFACKDMTEGKLFVVVGCGGDRDKTKRPKMAEIAVRKIACSRFAIL